MSLGPGGKVAASHNITASDIESGGWLNYYLSLFRQRDRDGRNLDESEGMKARRNATRGELNKRKYEEEQRLSSINDFSAFSILYCLFRPSTRTLVLKTRVRYRNTRIQLEF